VYFYDFILNKLILSVDCSSSSARLFSPQPKDIGVLRRASIYSVFGSLFSCACLAWVVWVFPFFHERWDLVIKTSDVGGPLVYRTAPEVEVSYNNVLVNPVVDRRDSKGVLSMSWNQCTGRHSKGLLSKLYRSSLLRHV